MAVIKPSINFIGGSSNVNLGAKVDEIVSAMMDNIYFPGQQSGIADVATLNTAFKTAIVAAADGSRMALADLRAKRAELNVRLRTLAYYVQLHCNDDMTILLSSAFPVQKSTRTPSTLLPAPTVQNVKAGMLSGTVAMKVFAQGALTYGWRCYLAAVPNVMINAPQTSAANTVFTGLTPGASYFFQCNAVNSAGTSEWSTAYAFIAT